MTGNKDDGMIAIAKKPITAEMQKFESEIN
jgi:hypothetical protein